MKKSEKINAEKMKRRYRKKIMDKADEFIKSLRPVKRGIATNCKEKASIKLRKAVAKFKQETSEI